MKRLVFLLLVFVSSLSACQSMAVEVAGENVTVGGGSYTNINSQELDEMLKNKDFVFVNVHIPFAGNIHDTDLSIPYDQIAQSEYLTQLPTDKNTRIVLYCRSGRMSQIAAEELISLGFTNIWNLKEGMVGWEQAGYEIEK